METATRADVLATLSRRYRERYGERLVALYALPNDPYEPEEALDTESLDVVVVLRDVNDHFAETSSVVEVAMQVEQESGFRYGIFPHHAAETDELVRFAEEEGVLL